MERRYTKSFYIGILLTMIATAITNEVVIGLLIVIFQVLIWILVVLVRILSKLK